MCSLTAPRCASPVYLELSNGHHVSMSRYILALAAHFMIFTYLRSIPADDRVMRLPKAMLFAFSDRCKQTLKQHQ